MFRLSLLSVLLLALTMQAVSGKPACGCQTSRPPPQVPCSRCSSQQQVSAKVPISNPPTAETVQWVAKQEVVAAKNPSVYPAPAPSKVSEPCVVQQTQIPNKDPCYNPPTVEKVEWVKEEVATANNPCVYPATTTAKVSEPCIVQQTTAAPIVTQRPATIITVTKAPVIEQISNKEPCVYPDTTTAKVSEPCIVQQTTAATIVTKRPTITAITEAPVRTTPSPMSDCANGELYPINAGSCDQFLMCRNRVYILMVCPPGLGFNDETKSCDWSANVPACGV